MSPLSDFAKKKKLDFSHSLSLLYISIYFILYSSIHLTISGKGAVYGYDAVGSYKRDDYGAMGTGQNFVMPILDNLVSFFVVVVCE